jgi:hypothetical protein
MMRIVNDIPQHQQKRLADGHSIRQTFCFFERPVESRSTQ